MNLEAFLRAAAAELRAMPPPDDPTQFAVFEVLVVSEKSNEFAALAREAGLEVWRITPAGPHHYQTAVGLAETVSQFAPWLQKQFTTPKGEQHL